MHLARRGHTLGLANPEREGEAAPAAGNDFMQYFLLTTQQSECRAHGSVRRPIDEADQKRTYHVICSRITCHMRRDTSVLWHVLRRSRDCRGRPYIEEESTCTHAHTHARTHTHTHNTHSLTHACTACVCECVLPLSQKAPASRRRAQYSAGGTRIPGPKKQKISSRRRRHP